MVEASGKDATVVCALCRYSICGVLPLLCCCLLVRLTPLAQDFDNVGHSDDANEMMKKYLIGTLKVLWALAIALIHHQDGGGLIDMYMQI